MLAGVMTKLLDAVELASARQTVRSLVLPPMRITPSRPSNRIRPSSDELLALSSSSARIADSQLSPMKSAAICRPGSS
jgi:hypothetical protein